MDLFEEKGVSPMLIAQMQDPSMTTAGFMS
ncbi:hypothetical protein C804_05007 [Lachnospiraceae bacterium A4]|jgi:hypothetical protein|nr:hypothetical protein C804_05007 [Lachnospiraceae bacterium A4]